MVSWPPVRADAYNITVVPLTTPLVDPLDSLINSTLADAMIVPGKASNSITIGAGALTMTFDSGSWANASAGVFSAPRVVRRMLEAIPATGGNSNSYMQVVVDCSGAPTQAAAACGILVYNGANRMPLLFFGLRRNNSADVASWEVAIEGVSTNRSTLAFPFAATTPVRVPWGSGAGVQLHVERTANPAAPMVFAARLLPSSGPSLTPGNISWTTNATVRLVPILNDLPAHQPGALYFGLMARALNASWLSPPAIPPGSSSVYTLPVDGPTGRAVFTSLTYGMTRPGSLPLDAFGKPDVCTAPMSASLAAVTQTVVSNWTAMAPPAPIMLSLNNGTWNTTANITVNATTLTATFSSLSANFPYTVTVTPFNFSSGGRPVLIGPASPPIPGTWFWARRMPPRAHKVLMWLDTKGFKDWNTTVCECRDTAAGRLCNVISRPCLDLFASRLTLYRFI